jgi:hypothetical protein
MFHGRQPQEVASVASDASAVRWWHIVGTDNQQALGDETQHAQDAKSTPSREYIFSSSPATIPERVLSSDFGIDLGFNILYKLTVTM